LSCHFPVLLSVSFFSMPCLFSSLACCWSHQLGLLYLRPTPRHWTYFPQSSTPRFTNPTGQHHAVWIPITVHTFPYLAMHPMFPAFLLDCLTLEDGTDMQSWNVGIKPSYSV
jgi:hypothetical protein